MPLRGFRLVQSLIKMRPRNGLGCQTKALVQGRVHCPGFGKQGDTRAAEGLQEVVHKTQTLNPSRLWKSSLCSSSALSGFIGFAARSWAEQLNLAHKHMSSVPPSIPLAQKKNSCANGCGMLVLAGVGLIVVMGMLHEDKDTQKKENLSDSQAKVGSASKPAPKSDAESEIQKSSIGSSFSLGGFEYTVTSAKIENPDLNLASQGVAGFAIGIALQANGIDDTPSKVVAVRYVIKNLGSEEDAVSTTDFEVRDSKGRKFTCNSEITAKFKGNTDELDPGTLLGMETLPPGIPRKGIQAFELPNDSFDGELTLYIPKKGLFTSGAYTIPFTLPKVVQKELKH